MSTLVQSAPKAINERPEVWRDRLSHERGVEPLKVPGEGEFDGCIEARLGEDIKLAFFHDAGTLGRPERSRLRKINKG